MSKNQQAAIEWRTGGVPVSTRFDDPYFSLDDGLAETRYVFLRGNGLPARFHPGFHIAELGFGTGLNMLSALSAWIASGHSGQLHFTSFEAFPLSAPDMDRALQAFPEISHLSPPLLEAWAQGETHFQTGTLKAQIILGDARQTLPDWPGLADAWFLDGFSPAQNPELWQPDLLQAVAAHTAANGSFATYSAAGSVRRALQAAGFSVRREPGFGRKRHMTTGKLTA